MSIRISSVVVSAFTVLTLSVGASAGTLSKHGATSSLSSSATTQHSTANGIIGTGIELPKGIIGTGIELPKGIIGTGVAQIR
jgi:hypothetical protein